MIVVRELELTCESCPAQWQGRTVDGRFVYVRYRSGWLQVGVGDTFKAAVCDESDVRRLGDGYDGFMTYEELKAATRGRVEWPI